MELLAAPFAIRVDEEWCRRSSLSLRRSSQSLLAQCSSVLHWSRTSALNRAASAVQHHGLPDVTITHTHTHTSTSTIHASAVSSYTEMHAVLEDLLERHSQASRFCTNVSSTRCQGCFDSLSLQTLRRLPDMTSARACPLPRPVWYFVP